MLIWKRFFYLFWLFKIEVPRGHVVSKPVDLVLCSRESPLKQEEATTRILSIMISFHQNISTSWVPHRPRLQGFLSPCMPPFIWLNASKAIPCYGSYLVITTMWHPLSCSASSYSFLHVLPLDLNRRSRIVLDTSTWSWPLTQDPFCWTLVLMINH
jgi:hypothetical protein